MAHLHAPLTRLTVPLHPKSDAMLSSRRNKIAIPATITRIIAVSISTILFSGCQTTAQHSTDDAAPGQSFNFFEQNPLDERAAELDQREAALAARETAITAREREIVTVFAELLKQKEQLEQQRQQPSPASTSQKTVRQPPKPASRSTPSTTAKAADDKSNAKDKRKILGGIEYVFLDPPGINLSARIDTGAQTSSLNALDMVEFERDGKPFIKFHIIHPETGEQIEMTRRVRGHTKIKKHKIEAQRRPIVRLRVKLGDLDEHISFTLVDRSKFKQQVLIGRNFLRDLAIVDVSKEFTVPKTEPDPQP